MNWWPLPVADRAAQERRWRAFTWLRGALAGLARPDIFPGQAAQWPAGRDAGASIIALADHHMVTPALAYLLRDHAGVPPEFARHLEAVRYLNGQRNEAIVTGIESAASALTAAGIEPVFLKGAASVLDALFPEIACRFLGDVDLLVGEADVIRAGAVLREAGFSSVEQRAWEVVATPQHHLPIMRNPLTGVGIEIHWRMVDPLAGRLPDAARVLGRAVPRVFCDRTYLIPHPADRALQNIIHHHVSDLAYFERTCELRQVLDLALIVRRYREQATGELEGGMLPPNLEKIAAHALGLARWLGGEDVNPAPLERIRPRIERPPRRSYTLLALHWRKIRDNPRYTANYLRPSRWPARLRNFRASLRRPGY